MSLELGKNLVSEKLCNFNYSCKIISESWKPNLSEFSNTQPQQLVFRIKDIGTWCIFPTGSCRLTGCKAFEEHLAAKNILEKTFRVTLSDMRLTNVTAVLHVLDMLEFESLCEIATILYDGVYVPEIFNACVLSFGSIRACIFHTGKIVIMGLRSLSDLNFVKAKLEEIMWS